MVAYIQKIAEDLKARFEWPRKPEGHRVRAIDSVDDRLTTLREELDRLDPRDFVADSRYEFVEVRCLVRGLIPQAPVGRRASGWVEMQQDLEAKEDFLYRTSQEATDTEASGAGTRDPDELRRLRQQAFESLNDNRQLFDRAAKVCGRVVAVLNSYSGQGAQALPRSFAFVHNADLRAIVERDYAELSHVLFPEGAWKSVVIMAGSILEAILYDLLVQDAPRAMASPEAPKKKGGLVKDITQNTAADEWKLTDLIEVAVDLAFLPKERADTIDQVLRDYRNFVHPRKELKAAHPCTEAEALLAKGALDGVYNHLK
jgi:hypothetical protein